jgi:hypothetical protein
LSHWGRVLKANVGCLDDLSPLLHAEEHLEQWGRSLFSLSFLLIVPVFVALAIIIL